MKIALLLFTLVGICQASQDDAVVSFTNGDQISGRAVSLDLNTLTWESDSLNEPAEFKLKQVLDLIFPAKLDPKFQEDVNHEALLELTNGDIVKGLLIGLNDKDIRLKTWYAGEMIFRRLNVKSITIKRANKVLYRGPSGIDDWTLSGSPDSWAFNKGELASTEAGGIARNFDFPKESQISYDVSWRGLLNTKVILFSPELSSSSPKSGYEIIFQRSMVQLRRLDGGNLLNSKISQRRTQPIEKAKVDIRFSKRTNKIMVFFDDELCGMWDDLELDKMPGNGFHFVSTNNNEIAISNIVVSDWDGYVDESIADNDQFQIQRFPGNIQFNRDGELQTTKAKELPEGRMMLANGDTIEGEVLGIEGDIIKIKTPFTEVSFPVYRINNIVIKNANSEDAMLYKGDVKAHLADGSKFIFRIDDVKDGKLIGFSQNFGSAEFDQSAFKRIEFNIHWRDK